MPTIRPIKIMIVDDHPAIIQSLSDVLNTVPTFEVVGVAKNSEEARQLGKNKEIDLVILDIRLPDGNGIDLTREFNAYHKDLAILIYSGESDVELVRQARNAGACGYLLKGADLSVIKQAINIVMAGGIYMDPDLPEIPKPSNRGETLTKCEEGVMRLFAKWMTTQEISEELGLDLSTIKSHRNNIKWKLDIRNTPHFYREAIRRYGNPDDSRYIEVKL